MLLLIQSRTSHASSRLDGKFGYGGACFEGFKALIKYAEIGNHLLIRSNRINNKIENITKLD